MRRAPRAALAPVALLAALLAGGCDLLRREPPAVPDEAAARAYYADTPGIRSVDVRGNLVELHVIQDLNQLRRGGSLWARVGPYVYIFSPGTRDLFTDYPGVAAVRVVTILADGEEVARATLRRDALTEPAWRRSLNLLGHALQGGTERPTLLEQLVQWGEEHTDYRYSRSFVPN
jgi:hypothetical protein